jgi:hypothetical protein
MVTAGFVFFPAAELSMGLFPPHAAADNTAAEMIIKAVIFRSFRRRPTGKRNSKTNDSVVPAADRSRVTSLFSMYIGGGVAAGITTAVASCGAVLLVSSKVIREGVKLMPGAGTSPEADRILQLSEILPT